MVVLHQEERKHSRIQIGREGQTLEKIEKARAKQRLKESGERFGRGKGRDTNPHPIEEKGKTRDIVGRKLGVSGRTAQDHSTGQASTR